MPAGFFIEVIGRSDEMLVGGVAYLAEGVICHDVRIPKVFDTMHTIETLAGLSPPVLEPPSKYLVVFTRNVFLYLRSAWLGLPCYVGNLKHIFKRFRITEITADAR